MTEFSNLGTTNAGTAVYLGGVPNTGTAGIAATLYPIATVFSAGLEAQSALGTTSLTGSDTVAVSHSGSVYLASLSTVLSAAGGITGLEVSNGTSSYTGITELFLEGGTLTHSGNTATFSVSGTGGGGTTIELTDGTHTLTAASEIVVSGATVSGSNPTGTITVSTGGGISSRPALSAFTESNHQTLCTAADISGGPIVVDFAPGGTYQAIDNWNQSVSGSEWLLTACLSQSYSINSAQADYATLGIGVKATNGQLIVLRVLGHQESLDLITMTNENSYNSDLSSTTDRIFSKVWYRIYYQSSNSSYPYNLYRSLDGYTWTFLMQWNGTSGVSGTFTAASALFFMDCGGVTIGHCGGTLWHWDIQTGTGSSLNPYSSSIPQ